MPYAAPSSRKSSIAKARSAKQANKPWESISFASTLYLHPILDALLATTPDLFHDELRLGLQEALVNAAKHGNQLDPQKVVCVRYAKIDGYYWWVVSDQGGGFEEPTTCVCPRADQPGVSDCGRGLFILHQVFDQVRWSNDGKEVHLAKQVRSSPFVSFVNPMYFVRLVEAWWRRWSTASVHSL